MRRQAISMAINRDSVTETDLQRYPYPRLRLHLAGHQRLDAMTIEGNEVLTYDAEERQGPLGRGRRR